jgi:hypothetical protein
MPACCDAPSHACIAGSERLWMPNPLRCLIVGDNPATSLRNTSTRHPSIRRTIACEYGVRRLHEGASTPAKRKASDVEAARQRVGRGDIGTVTFDEAATWLGLDPEPTRRAILAAVRA